MKTKKFIKRFARDQRGAVTVMVAVSLVVILGFSSLAVDLGYVYSVRNEVQNAADAVALAAAVNVIKAYDTQGADITLTDVVNAAMTGAQQSATENGNLTLRPEDVVSGVWDASTKAFTPGGDTGTVNAIRIIIRRDSTANGPINLFLGGIIGIPTVDVSAEAIALLGGFVGSVPEGGVTFPMVINKSAYDAGAGIFTMGPNNADNAAWTTFFTAGGGASKIRDIICGCYPATAVKVGDDLHVYNGWQTTLLQATKQMLNKHGGQWKVYVPVVDTEHFTGWHKVVGFAVLVINYVKKSGGNKRIEGHFTTGYIPGGKPGGTEDFGAKSSSVVLVK